MFKKTDPQQQLFGIDTKMPDGLRRRLEKSWAHTFRMEILPILMRKEEGFSILYGETGRPNFSVGRLLGLCLLQEWHARSDQQALDEFGFDIRWRYALDVDQSDEAYLSRRSLVAFRSRLADKDPEGKLIRGVFEAVSHGAIEALGISTSDQRIDSTHIVSNICTRGRVDLFKKTIGLFLNSLHKRQYSAVPRHIRKWHKKETSRGWFGGGNLAQRRAKAKQLAEYMHRLIELFEKNKSVNSSEAYQLLVRLFNEQCEIKSPSKEDGGDGGSGETDGDSGETEGTDSSDKSIEIVVKKKTKGETLQSPFDPDASYGHKGGGYSTHITETCNNEDKPEIITDYETHGAARSDMGKTPDVLDRLASAELMPEVLYEDGGYPTVPSTIDIQDRGVELVAPVNRGWLGDDIMGRDRFEFDEEGHITTCPVGHPPVDHRQLSNGSVGRTLHAVFNGDLCRACSKLEQCPVRAPNHRSKGDGPRQTKGNFRLEITRALRVRDDMFVAQQTDEWKERYAIRSGVEATMSELKRSHGIGRLRVRGLARVQFAVACKVIACNIKRWWKASNGSSGSTSGPLRGRLKGLSAYFGAILHVYAQLRHRTQNSPGICTGYICAYCHIYGINIV
ncbi:MAG: transposase [Myxococcota bacterium]|nr:transposase [Myxococcota bacterium]